MPGVAEEGQTRTGEDMGDMKQSALGVGSEGWTILNRGCGEGQKTTLGRRNEMQGGRKASDKYVECNGFVEKQGQGVQKTWQIGGDNYGDNLQ